MRRELMVAAQYAGTDAKTACRELCGANCGSDR
jgi:hypothetical protein